MLNLKKNVAGAENVCIEDIMQAFPHRSFSFFLFLFALPSALPVPAVGYGTLLAIPLLLLTGQQALGFQHPWLPRRIRDYCLTRDQIEGFVDTALPWIHRIEVLIRPRLQFMTGGVMKNVVGIFGLIMSLSILIPLPFTNTVPSLGLALMAVGLLLQDGLALLSGAVIGCAWIGLLLFVTIVYGPEGVDILKTAIKSFL